MLKQVKRFAVVYYSRTGYSRHAATQIAKALNADLFELTVEKYSAPRLGYLIAGFDSLRQRLPALTSPLPVLERYEGVAICGPVWTSYPAAPLRSFLQAHPALPPAVGLFLTSGDEKPPTKAFATAEADLGRSIAVRHHLPNALDGNPVMGRRVASFCAHMQAMIKTSA